MRADNCCTGACEQGKQCPLVLAKKQGFLPPVIQKKPEPTKPEPSANFWLAVLLAFIAFVILVDPHFRFDLPFVGK